MRSELVESIDLHEFPKTTLNYFSTNSQRLHLWCKKNDIHPGQRVIIVGRSGRVRILEYKTSGWIEVTLVEWNPKLSTQVMIFAHYEKQMRGDPRTRLCELRGSLERRLDRQLEREERAKERARERAQGRRN